ncbi:MAG: DnaJ domain-containing protein [Deltaproteobacteria bacterium]|nr:DnaJ domain-containing protein [Deltaproteobacteria bacterium]
MEDKLAVVPRMRDGIDIMKAGLSVEEGFLASRIDGRTSVRDLAHLVGKSADDTHRLLVRLARAGIVRMGDEPELDQNRPTASDAAVGEYGNYIFAPALMQVTCDLEQEERKRVIFYHDHLDRWTHYELLQTKRKDDVKEIKRAYFERSKEWHPDRFRRPNLGPFKAMIDRIFQQVQEAYRVLSDPKRRETYDEANVLMADEDEIADMLAEQRKKEREARRIREAEERRKKNNPMRQRLNKARAFYDEAKQLRASGQLLEALRVVQLAATFEDKPEYQELLATLQVEAGEFRIQPLMRRGNSQENLTNWEAAIEAFQEAVRLAPEHAQARLRLAFNLIMGGRDPQEASPHAQKAALVLTEDPEAHFVLGLCYEKGGMEKAAVRAYARAVELKPNYSDAKKRLRSLKWGF